jgi:hypothetical protein
MLRRHKCNALSWHRNRVPYALNKPPQKEAFPEDRPLDLNAPEKPEPMAFRGLSFCQPPVVDGYGGCRVD